MAPQNSVVVERDVDSSSGVVQKDLKKRWVCYIWDTFDKVAGGAAVAVQIGYCYSYFCFLGYFIKYLDQVNINNAFVSGMKEGLGMYGNQLNYIQACWTVGYVIGEIPSNILLTRVRPRYWIPAMKLL